MVVHLRARPSIALFRKLDDDESSDAENCNTYLHKHTPTVACLLFAFVVHWVGVRRATLIPLPRLYKERAQTLD